MLHALDSCLEYQHIITTTMHAGEILARAGIPLSGGARPRPPSVQEMRSRIKAAESAVDKAAADADAVADRARGRRCATTASRDGFVSSSFNSGALHAFHGRKGSIGAFGRGPQSDLGHAYMLSQNEVSQASSDEARPRGKVKQPARTLPRPSVLTDAGQDNGDSEDHIGGAMGRMRLSPVESPARVSSTVSINLHDGPSAVIPAVVEISSGEGIRAATQGRIEPLELHPPPPKLTPQSRYSGIQERLKDLKRGLIQAGQ